MLTTHRPETTSAQIRSAIARRSPWALEALQALIAVDSVAPDEAAGQDRLAAVLRDAGFEPRLIQPDEQALHASPAYIHDDLPIANRPNLVCEWGRGEPSAPTLILNSHIDTEPWRAEADRWTVPPLGGVIADGRVYGRGAVDAKGQLMTAVLAVAALKEMGAEPRGRIILQSVVGEEPSGNGTLSLCLEPMVDVTRAAAVVLEPTGGHVAYGHRGIMALRFVVAGGSSHAALGGAVNAISAAGILANVLHHSLDGWYSAADTLYGPPTVNVGRIAGGANIFSSPIDCSVECGIRYAPGTANDLLAFVLAAVSQDFEAKSGLPWSSVQISVTNHFDAGETPADNRLVESLLRAAKRIQPESTATLFPGGCDARHFINRLGIPTVIFGPGSLRQAHGVDEYMEIDSWVGSAAALAGFIFDWFDEPEGGHAPGPDRR